MSSNLSIEQGSEKFAFICTLTLYRPHNSDGATNNQSDQNSSPDFEYQRSHTLSEPSTPDKSSALATTNENKTNGSSLAISHPKTIIDDWYILEEPEDNFELDLFALEGATESNIADNSSRKKISLDKILLVSSFSYLVFVLWWLVCYVTGQNVIPFLAEKETIPKADAEFIDYMKRSLETIDRQFIAQEKESNQKEEDPTVVYVPVYTQAANNPINRYTPQPLPTAIPLPPAPPSQIKIPAPPPPSELASVKIPETPKIEDKQLATAISTPKINSTLVGLLELGEASAALFKINGITQRIWLGESIENTGWTLDSVTREKATVSNRGQSRILSIGESF